MRIRLDLKIIIFLIVFYFTNQLRIYLIIMLFCILHEMAHILVGMLLKMKPEKIEVMPFGLSVSFIINYNDKHRNVKEIFVALAGPFMSFILAILFKYIDLKYITTEESIYSNILILIFNLLPIYPLDGGRIIKAILHIKFGYIQCERLINKISYITIIVLTVISSVAVYYYKNIAIFFVCLFLWITALKEKNGKTLDILQ